MYKLKLIKEEDGQWFLTDGEQSLSVSDMLPEDNITGEINLKVIVLKLGESRKLTHKERALLKKWKATGAL